MNQAQGGGVMGTSGLYLVRGSGNNLGLILTYEVERGTIL